MLVWEQKFSQGSEDAVDFCEVCPKCSRRWLERKTLFFLFFFDRTGMIYMHLVSTGQTLNKEYYVKAFWEFRKRYLRKWPAPFKSGQWHFHLDNAAVHNSILVTDYLTKRGMKTSSSSRLSSPSSLWLLVIPLAQRQMRRWKKLWRRSLTRSYKRTSTAPFRSCWNGTTSALQPEEITSKGTRVSCVYNQ